MWELLNRRMKWKQNTNWFDKNKGNISPWRPKKGIALINQTLKEKWYKPATKQDIEVNYMHLMNFDEKDLKELATDKKQPMIIRILVKNMLSWKGFDVIEKMLDRWIWKAKQTVDTNLTWDVSITEFKIPYNSRMEEKKPKK